MANKFQADVASAAADLKKSIAAATKTYNAAKKAGNTSVANQAKGFIDQLKSFQPVLSYLSTGKATDTYRGPSYITTVGGTGSSTSDTTGDTTGDATRGVGGTGGGGISATVPTVGDTLSMEQLQAQFGIAASVLANNPSLVDALNRILGKNGGPIVTDPALQEAIIKGTAWYRDQTDTQRSYDYYKATNPGQFAADLQANASSIVKQWSALGLSITAEKAIEYANNMMKQSIIKDGKVVRFDQDYLNKLMADSITFTKTGTIDGRVTYTGLAGKLETMASELYKRAWDYGFAQTTSNAVFDNWFESTVKGIVAGTTNPEDIDNMLQERAKSFAPGLAKFIDQGQTLRQAADPWLNAIANTWEVDPASLDLNDDYVQRAINVQDKEGNFTTMNLYDTKKLAARNKEKMDATQKFKEQKTSIAKAILRDFGFLG